MTVHSPFIKATKTTAWRQTDQTLQWLRLQGIPVLSAKDQQMLAGQLRLYQCWLDQAQLLRMEQAEERGDWLQHPLADRTFRPITSEADNPEHRLVKHLAVRSLYGLGLNSGRVVLAAFSIHRVKVLQVQAFDPEQEQRDFIREAREELRARLEASRQAEIVLGADPEFALRQRSGEMALASDYFGKRGKVGCDSTRYREELALNQWPLVEIRPDPSPDPAELTSRIEEALQLAAARIDKREVEWLAGGMPFAGYPTGGHIHFSGIPLHFGLLRQLDAYLAVPLVLAEDEGCRRRRPRYGFLGDVREKDYGGFEYRTLPSWLVSPLITSGVLSLAKLVATHWRSLPAVRLQGRLLIAYYRGRKEMLRPLVLQLWAALKQLPDYARYASVLNRYFDYLLSGEVWPVERDFRPHWGL
ncbi:putative amidoligase domain-containing protein [Brevibacillus fulvus]|uniref:PhiEco32-like amidoligase-type 2 protein n=1 Tax=Brevibacillus fulvus TaxID=1125967 RepID=A0A939BSJ2_9BACL|nr:hypothetical protein [Brevibacillus fulvus]MBM7590523.1 hypothetical protein [Brevibacillus fulvus]